MTTTFKDIQIGQQLYAVYGDKRNGEPFVVTVEKRVRGSGDIMANGIRFKEWDHDGYAVAHTGANTSIKLYLSKEEYEAKEAWRNFVLYVDRVQLTKEQRNKILAIIAE